MARLDPPKWDYAAGQVFTMSGSSQQSAALPTQVVRLATGAQPAWYISGSNPTAVSGASNYLPPNTVEVIRIGFNDKVAVLQAGTAGDFHVVPTDNTYAA